MVDKSIIRATNSDKFYVINMNEHFLLHLFLVLDNMLRSAILLILDFFAYSYSNSLNHNYMITKLLIYGRKKCY